LSDATKAAAVELRTPATTGAGLSGEELPLTSIPNDAPIALADMPDLAVRVSAAEALLSEIGA